MIGAGFKSCWYDELYNGLADGTNEIQIDFGQTRRPVSFFLINNCAYFDAQMMIGSSHVRVGNDSAAFSTNNTKVKSDIVDGGIFSLEKPESGRFIAFRRDGPDPFYGSSGFLMS